MSIGILAYGSLIANPDKEIQDRLERVISKILTPFPVEYARKSSMRCDAPTLVPVLAGEYSPVHGAILLLKPEIDLQTAQDILYRRERHRVGDLSIKYRAPRLDETGRIRIEELSQFAGINRVLYTNLKANFCQILDPKLSDFEKAELLAHAAVDSLDKVTFDSGMDGIQYLTDACRFGIRTRLTELYTQAVLTLAGNAPDLTTARSWLAQQKRLV